MKITLDKDRLEVTEARFFGEIYKKLAACPDRKAFKFGRFFCNASAINVSHLLEVFPEADWVGGAEEHKFKFLAFKKQEEELKNLKGDDVVMQEFPEVFKTKPFDHQYKAFIISKDLGAYGLFFEQGCGKTKVTIDNAVYLFLKKKIDKLIIIAPNGVHSNWINTEIPVHCNTEYDAFCWKGKMNKKVKALWDLVRNSRKLQIYSFNVECFVSKKNQAMLKELLNNCMLVIDESQSIKNPMALRTKFLVGISDKAAYRRILSGTPVTNGLEDIFSQFQFLDPAILVLRNFTAFRARYCVTKRFFNPLFPDDLRKSYVRVLGYKGIDEIQEKIKTFTTRVLKVDCLDLPPKIYQREFVTLSPEQLRIDAEIQEEGITWVKQCRNNNEPITYAMALTRLTKRQQVACGYLLNEDEQAVLEIVKPEKNPRLLKLRSLLDVIQGKVIIWARFTQDVDYIMKMLGKEAVRYDGKVSTDDKEFNKVKFQTDTSIKYFVAKPIKGLTLTAGTTAIYYSNDFDLEKRLQSEDRNHRFGTKEALEAAGLENILYIDLEAVGSIDTKLIAALRAKKKMSDLVLQDPESMFMES